MIEIKNLTFGYGKIPVLKNISLTIPPHSLTALIGLNGAGKSTLFRCLSKQEQITDRQILVNSQSIGRYSFREYARIVSVVPQLSSIRQIDYKVRDFMVEGRTPYLPAFSVPGKREYQFSEKIALKMGAAQYLDTPFCNLSGGQQQLVLLARALVQDTSVIILDEPMSALDLRNQAFLLRVIRQLAADGKTVLFSTHNPNHALLLGCEVILLDDGAVVCHGPARQCLSPENLRRVFGSSVALTETAAGVTASLRL